MIFFGIQCIDKWPDYYLSGKQFQKRPNGKPALPSPNQLKFEWRVSDFKNKSLWDFNVN